METETFPCLYCREPILTQWALGGGMMRGEDHCLVGDSVAHHKCLDKHLEEHPFIG